MAEIRDWQIERFVLGELPGPERDRLASALALDPALRSRVEACEASNREILEAHPPRIAAAAVRERLSRPASPARAWARPALALAASLAVVGLAVSLMPPRSIAPPAPEATRIKGMSPHLAVFRQTPAGIEALADGELVHAGDVIQLTYQAAGRRFGAILSIDGRGVVTVHLPLDGGHAVPLGPAQAVRLPSAYRLDDAPRWERFVLVTSDEAFDVAPVVEAAGRFANGTATPAHGLDLSPSLEQSWFTLNKDDRR